MSIELNLFPTVDKKLFDKIGFFSNEYEFSYISDGDIQVLETNSNYALYNNDSIQVSDPHNQWHSDGYDLHVKRGCRVENPDFLFGSNGIADTDSVLGIATIWTSKSSNQRGVFEVGQLRYRQSNKTHMGKFSFSKGQIRGVLNLETVIYLKKPGFKKTLPYATAPGTILGTLDMTTIILDGNGSVFPIIEVDEPSQPLWYVTCTWSDPLSDSFSEENVRLCINKAHPSYELLKLNEGIKDSYFFIEILASAMQTIILKAMTNTEWDQIVRGESLEEGSVGEAINYFINNFNWDTTSPERLALSIRQDFKSRL